MRQWPQAALQLGRFPQKESPFLFLHLLLLQVSPSRLSAAGAPGQDTLATPPKGKGVVQTMAGPRSLKRWFQRLQAG